MEMKDGLLLVEKDPGFTSHDVVQRVRRILRQKRIGHCGTLDPDATGLLLLTLGTATRLTRFLIRAPKVYEGTIRFGVATDTYDASGRVVAEAPPEAVAALTREQVAAAMHGFEGEIRQQPPPFSAKKVQGVKFYELARRGEEVPDEPKEVTVYEFTPLGEIADGRLRFQLACSSGTYARGLAHDLGAALGLGAHLSDLRRTRIGNFRADDAVSVAVLEARTQAGEPVGPAWIPFDQIPLPFGEVTADPQQEHRIHHGQTVLVRELAGEEGDWVKLVNRRREFIAVGTVVERIGTAGVGIVQPKVVFR
ncbi:MAG TPA: tRNA pseudouridine(55) synthase TruB [Thermoanaerobaculia bacterium]|jgi:tRNA pseudouridine55 synthase|nr:tRNA pseudouridine(55) synthase TruB [Thermoanaerobaculia bacterium]